MNLVIKGAKFFLFGLTILAGLGFPTYALLRILTKDGIESPNAASWAQALGTILAICAASAAAIFQVERARQNSLEMDARTLKRKFSALCAILDDAYEQCMRVKVEFQDIDDAFGALSFLLTFDERAFEDAIANIEKIPLNELESYEAVRSISRFRNRLISIKGHTLSAMDANRDLEAAPDHAIKHHVTGLISDADSDYKNAVAALGGVPLTSIPPFSY